VAGDWIKMRGNLWDDPRVAKLCDLTGQGEATIVGALYWLWATADQHTEDGCMPGLTLRQIDRKTGVQGFGAALCEIDWLRDDPQGVVLVKFEEHNGSSAKRRCSDAQRKASNRGMSARDADNERTEPGQDADEMRRLAELEKRREEKKKENPPTPLPGGAFDGFWKLWPANPRKVAKDQCRRKWATKGCEAISGQVMSALTAAIASEAWAKNDGEFIPAPLVWLNQSRWEAPAGPDPPAVKASAEVAKTKELLDSYVQTPEQRAASEKARQLAMSALKERRIQ
jgi:hypothetical protein